MSKIKEKQEMEVIFPSLKKSMFSVTNVTGYDFEAEILGMRVAGTFSVEFDDDIPMVQVDEIYEEESLLYFKVADMNNVYDLIGEEIQENWQSSTWFEDRQAALIDYYYERGREEGWGK